MTEGATPMPQRNEAAERLLNQHDSIAHEAWKPLIDAALAEERRRVVAQIRPFVDTAMGPAGCSMAAADAVRAIRTRLDEVAGESR